MGREWQVDLTAAGCTKTWHFNSQLTIDNSQLPPDGVCRLFLDEPSDNSEALDSFKKH